MTNRLFIQAMNVHSGGGRSLLHALLQAGVHESGAVVMMDTRMEATRLPQNWTVRKVRPSILQRLGAERWLSNAAGEGDLVLCFGNLPPLFRNRAKTIVFLQNRYLIQGNSLAAFPIKTRLRLGVERLWFERKASYVDQFIVQTPSMRDLLLSSGLAKGKPVAVWPFMEPHAGYQRRLDAPPDQKPGNRFIYVASGEPHKNHRTLVEAWTILAKEEIFPELLVTVDRDQHGTLCQWLDEMTRLHRLLIVNHGTRTSVEIAHLYKNVDALVFPSTFESFGLPLIEARQAKLAVIASELDFVRDVIDPEETFDPLSPVSIARAVKRFMRATEAPLPLMSAAQFLEQLIPKSA